MPEAGFALGGRTAMAKSVEFVTLIPIRNMSRAIRFYTKQLGGRVVMRGTGQMRNSWSSLRIAGHHVWLIAPDKREKRSLAYTTLVVTNAKRYVRSLQRKGVRFQPGESMGPGSKVEGPVVSTPYGTTAFFKDPEGNLWMVFQIPSGM
jgi:catechol 2,3-dioxygenase-like lactoylglutathione lyase family enzyme